MLAYLGAEINSILKLFLCIECDSRVVLIEIDVLFRWHLKIRFSGTGHNTHTVRSADRFPLLIAFEAQHNTPVDRAPLTKAHTLNPKI